MEIDPRISVIDERLEGIARIIAVSGGKGGVGKSVVSCLLSLSLSRFGYKVGLLDLDLSSPSDHVILGIKNLAPKEERGIVPPVFHGIKFMSITLYAKDEPTPLRGEEISNVIKEILCITRWGDLDFLVIDMPPGIGDELFETIELLKKSEFLLVSIPSKVAFETVKKMAILLRELNAIVIGVLENMIRNGSFVRDECEKLNLNYIGHIRFDEGLEDAIGDIKKLESSKAFEDICRITRAIMEGQKR